MSSASVTSARIQEAKYWGKSSHLLSFEEFPHYGLLKTYNKNFISANKVSDHMPLFYGTYNQLDFLNENKTLFTSAQKSKKSIGLVTTVKLENLLSTLNRFGLSKCSESNRSNCRDASCNILYGCLAVDIIIGKTSGLVQSEDMGCDCFRDYGHNETEQLVKTRKRIYVNRTEEFKKLEPKCILTRLLSGLLSEKDFIEKQLGGNLSMLGLSNVVEKSIQILNINPNGYFMVVLVSYDDIMRTMKVVSALSDSIRGAISFRDTLLVVTSDIISTQICTHGNIENWLLKKGANSSTEITASTHSTKNCYNVTGSFNQLLSNISSNIPHTDAENNCTEDCANNYLDIPIYAYGSYPDKIPAVQDQADFGLKIMKILEAKHYEDIKFDLETGEIDSNIFQKDIKAAMADIDEMTKELFSEWI
ncbi:uncharacterized protein [Hetaerina americana]|uniref:uncharacterized protein n=1 Tax=Hetaerina americana TaxID=62018 RepID=UPI003A7F596A